MMINVNDEKHNLPTFPWIGVLSGFGTIVLFFEEMPNHGTARGMVIGHTENCEKDHTAVGNSRPLGMISDDWMYMNFTPWNERVTVCLKNDHDYSEYSNEDRAKKE